MTRFSKEYLEFEVKCLKELTDLWYLSNDEELRLLILGTRKVLQRIYDGGDQISTGQDSGTDHRTANLIRTKK